MSIAWSRQDQPSVFDVLRRGERLLMTTTMVVYGVGVLPQSAHVSQAPFKDLLACTRPHGTGDPGQVETIGPCYFMWRALSVLTETSPLVACYRTAKPLGRAEAGISARGE